MPIYSAGDIIEVHLLSRTTGVQAKNVLHFEVKQTMVVPSTLATQMREFYCPDICPIISNRGVFYGIISRRVEPTPVTEYVTEGFADFQGCITSNMTHEGLSNIIVLRHGLGIGVRTGRMYIPFPPLGFYLNGSMNADHIGHLNDVITALNAHFSTTGNNAWLRQMIKGKVPGGFVYRPVVQYQWRMFPGMQRKRRRGVGA